MKKYIFLLLSVLSVIAVEREFTINVDPGKEDCFYQYAKEKDVIDLDYQVIDGGHGDLDITFHLVDPTGRILVADFKKSENNHRADVRMTGDYKFCFDNSFSSYNSKTVFFEYLIEAETDGEWDSEENFEFNTDTETYDIRMEEVQEIINGIRAHLNKARHLQDLIKSTEARDRNTAEENFFKVNTHSMLQLVLMFVVGLFQVFMVKSLFDEKSRGHRLWKRLR